MRKLEQVAAHHAGDGSAGSDRGDARAEIEEQVDKAGGNAAEQIEHQVFAVAKHILDIVAVDPEEPHVADEVHPAAMEEHGSDQRRQFEARGHHGVLIDEVVPRKIVKGNFEQEDYDVDGN